MKQQYLVELEKKLDLKAAKKNRPKSLIIPEDYINTEDPTMTFLKLSIPEVREFLKELINDFKKNNLSPAAQYEIIEHVWFKAVTFEARALALFWLDKQDVDFLVSKTKFLVAWVDRIGNWAHSDTYSGVLARIFEKNPQKLLTTFKSWNKHKNSWKRRNSLVGLMLYSRMRKKHPSFEICKSFIDSQLTAPEYYVQKAVGWTLREMYNVYPKKTYSYVKTNIKKVSPTAWYATSEKMSKTEKSILLKLRKTSL
jgi:3-methyladenine DNA glycosylase AlkD